MIRTLHPVNKAALPQKGGEGVVYRISERPGTVKRKVIVLPAVDFTLNSANIAEHKAEFYFNQKEVSKEPNAKRALHEIDVDLNDLFEANDDMMDDFDPAISYFQMGECSSDSSTSEKESEDENNM